jgi:flagellar protein FlaG
MVAKIDTELMFSVSTSQAHGVEKVHPVNAAKPLQKLPIDGKELPPEHHEVKEIDDAVDEINSHFQATHREIQFAVDDDSGRTVIKVMDMDTQEMIRQIPSEEVLKFARMLDEGADLELINTYI